MSHAVRFFFSTTGALVSLLAAILWVAVRPRSAAVRRFLFTVAITYALASVYAVPAIAPDPGRFATAWDAWFLPSVAGLDFSQQVVHELLGLPYDRIRGWEKW